MAKLPHIEFSLGVGEEDDEIIKLKGSLDTCAGSTIGYRPYHESICNHYPHLVKEFMDLKKKGIPMYQIGGIEEDGEGVEITGRLLTSPRPLSTVSS
jgi:hypothetical protein